MNTAGLAGDDGVARFRVRLVGAMTLLAILLTVAGLLVAYRRLTVETERALESDFHNAVLALHHVQEIRQAVLMERCRQLVRRPRIHAALEDNALDLLYPSAQDELRDVRSPEGELAGSASPVLQARFYRFLDAAGAVISPPPGAAVGELAPAAEARLAQDAAPELHQLGYLPRGAAQLDEVIATPISSTETGETIAALVLGFPPAVVDAGTSTRGLRSGIWMDGILYLPELSPAARQTVAAWLKRGPGAAHRHTVEVEGTPCRLYTQRLNPGSRFPTADEVCLYPLTDLLARQHRLLWQAAGACGALVVLGFGAIQLLAGQLVRPVEKLALVSEENRTQRHRAETALEMTHDELQRAARFSSDASHQLKTPVTVLRAGLEGLLAEDHLTPAAREEVATLVHQTFRITSIVEDLLLLSRMDAGRQAIRFSPLPLATMIDGLMDDLSVLPGGAEVTVEADCPSTQILGEERFVVIILQNLLENARKYNRPSGRIHVACQAAGEWITVTVGNTGTGIPAAAQLHIFERFHRGSRGEDVPGHGLGLNLARELARLHGGELRLVQSEDDWTEFAVRFQLAPAGD